MELWQSADQFTETVLIPPPLQSVKQLSNLISSLEILEPHNPELFYRMSLAFTRVVRQFSLFFTFLFLVIFPYEELSYLHWMSAFTAFLILS